MAHTEHYYTKFEAGQFYHIYNRTVGKELLFKGDDNFFFFLKKYNDYLSGVVETYAYCLLPNHFHLFIRVKEINEITPANTLSEIETEEEPIHKLVSHQFKKFFQSYALAFNKQQQRNGTLFQTPFKRALISDDSYFTQIIFYIHANPQNHGLIRDFRDWKWSSYNGFISDKSTKLKKQEVLNWFGGKEAYFEYHESLHEVTNQKKLGFE